MDRGWINKAKTSIEYKTGVYQFLQFAFRDRSRQEKILCPCINCANCLMKSYTEVREHLWCDGFLRAYTRWTHHGEDPLPPSVDNNSEIIEHNNLVEAHQPRVDDMEGLLHAALGGHNEPSLPNLGAEEISSIGHDEPSLPNLGAEEISGIDIIENQASEQNTEEQIEDLTLRKLLEDAKTELYPGCTTYSKLSFIIRLYQNKCLFGWSKEAFDAQLKLFAETLPDASNVPKNYYHAKKIIKSLGLDYIKIHACPNDCMLFYGKRHKQEICHICGSSRWLTPKKKGAVADCVNGKKKAAKVFRYFPLIPRLQRMFATERSSKNMRWHAEERTEDGKLRHPADAQAWKTFDTMFPDFKLDPRNIRLGLATDGFNPFGMVSSKHSTWPVILVPYNLPPWLCMKQSNFILSMIIPGPKGPGNDIDTYLEPLVEELLKLWSGVDNTYDALNKKEKFKLRASLLWTIHDFPAYASVSGYSTKGKYGCPICAEHTSSVWLSEGHKYCYMGHRQWLLKDHVFRTQKQQFDGHVEDRSAPKVASGRSVLIKLKGKEFGVKKLQNNKKETNKSKENKRKRNAKGNTSKSTMKQTSSKHDSDKKDPMDWWKKQSILFILPYWEHLLLRHNIDVMHTEKNVCENFINTLLDDAKSKDNLQARLDLVELGIRHDLHPKLLENGRYDIPKAPFVMSREKKEILCSTIQNIKTPVGYASNISRCVDMKAFKLTGLKSHDCHILIEHLLPVALRTCYPSKDTMSVVVELSNFFKSLCFKVLDISEIENLQEQVVLTLCKMEKLFVPSFFTLMVHLIVHLLDEAKLGGPVHYRWMYPFERYFVRLKGYVRNRAQPEGCMAEGYIADECLTFCSEFLKDIRNSSIEETNSEEHRYLFDSFGEPIGAVKNVRLDAKTLIQAHRYVLRHIDDIESYRREFLKDEKKRRKQSTFTAAESEKLINEQFHEWFYQKVLLLNNGDADIPEKILRLAEKPSYLGRQFCGLAINGFKFHTTSRENNRETQNSGVVNVSEDGDTNYYGRITEILELNYNGAFKIIMFKCDWFDVHRRAGMKQDEFGFTLLNSTRFIHTGHKLMDDPFVFSSQVEQVFYVQDGKHNDWCIPIRVKPRDLFDMGRTEDSADENDM